MQDPVQIFKAAVEALNRVDRDAIHDLVDPAVAFLPLRSAVSGPYLGYNGMNAFLDDNEEMFEYFRAQFDEFELLPDGRLIAVGEVRYKGRHGEVEACSPSAGIATFRDGRMLSWHDYGSEAAARERAAL